MDHSFRYLTTKQDNTILRVTLNRPEVHNAFNRDLIEELRLVFHTVAGTPVGEVRAVVLGGEGKSFCAGADVNWMRDSLNYSEEENVEDALRHGPDVRYDRPVPGARSCPDPWCRAGRWGWPGCSVRYCCGRRGHPGSPFRRPNWALRPQLSLPLCCERSARATRVPSFLLPSASVPSEPCK